MKALNLEKMKDQYLRFADRLQSVMLSTMTEDGKPFVSYAPFVKHDGKVYVYLSQAANHYQNLEVNPEADVMMIADEADTPNIFARQRARFVGRAVNLGNEGHEEIFTKFEERFNKEMIHMLKGLDFSLFELTLSEGRYVAGLGQAFDIDFSGERFEHVAGNGHKARKI